MGAHCAGCSLKGFAVLWRSENVALAQTILGDPRGGRDGGTSDSLLPGAAGHLAGDEQEGHRAEVVGEDQDRPNSRQGDGRRPCPALPFPPLPAPIVRGQARGLDQGGGPGARQWRFRQWKTGRPRFSLRSGIILCSSRSGDLWYHRIGSSRPLVPCPAERPR